VKKGFADGQIDMFEFVECQLLRLNMVSVSQLFDIKKRFIELDSDGSGNIERSELVQLEHATVQKKKKDMTVWTTLTHTHMHKHRQTNIKQTQINQSGARTRIFKIVFEVSP
jgi:hypothetical protein